MTHASLFSGIGGPEVAAAMLGWENLFHCEINPFGRKVLDYWFPKSVSYEDITKTSFKEWRGKVDVLTGGFPCQPFSYAGKRGGAEDARYLWPEMLRAIDEIRPAWVVGENVAGLSTMVEGWLPTEVGRGASLFEEGADLHDWIVEQTYTIERIARDIEGLGYSVQPVLIPAAACGAPHRRDRIFILAFNADADRRDDVRDAREDEGKGKGQRLQERDEIRIPRKSSELRSEICGDASDTNGGRCEPQDACGNSPGHRRHDALPRQRGLKAERADGFPAIQRDTADAHGAGREESVQPGRGADSEEDGAGVDDRAERFGRDGCFADPDLLPGNRWRNFPTVSPIHRGNDGLPFDVDDLTISFTSWRTESIKAYGNAIVPQVMYRIFEAIESLTIK